MAKKLLRPAGRPLRFIEEIFFIGTEGPMKDMDRKQPRQQTLEAGEVIFERDPMGRLPGKMNVWMRQLARKQARMRSGVRQGATMEFKGDRNPLSRGKLGATKSTPDHPVDRFLVGFAAVLIPISPSK